MTSRVRRCRGCGVLLVAGAPCTPCDTATVHVITDLGPTDGPGLMVRAQLLGPHLHGIPLFYYDPLDPGNAPPVRHRNHPCNPRPYVTSEDPA